MTDLLTSMLILKEHIKKIYARFGVYIDKLFKFVLSMLLIGIINHNVGFLDVLVNPLVMLGISLICAFLPMHFMAVLAGGLIVAHTSAVSAEIMAVVFLILLLVFILYLRFVPKEAFVVLLTPVAFALHIPYVVPLAMGLVGTPLSVVSVGSGVFIYYMLTNLAEYGPAIINAGSDSTTYNMSFFMEKVFQDKLVLLTVVTFVLVVLIVYSMKRMSVDHSWALAVGGGALLNILVMLIGDFVFDVNNSYLELFLGTIISAMIALILQSFVFSVDYSRTERVQFEDDEYYYYVKAVPKVSMAVEDKQVKRINRRKYMNFKRRSSQEPEDLEDLELTRPIDRNGAEDSDTR